MAPAGLVLEITETAAIKRFDLVLEILHEIRKCGVRIAIAYPEILQIMARTVLNQSGRAIEVMTIVLGVFLAVNLITSLAMNHWNRKMALQGR